MPEHYQVEQIMHKAFIYEILGLEFFEVEVVDDGECRGDEFESEAGVR